MSTENKQMKSEEPQSGDSIQIGDIGTGAAVAVGRGASAAVERGVVVGRDNIGTVITGDANEVMVTYDKAYERVIGYTSFVLKQLEINYKQTREQAQGWFRASLIAAGAGFVLVGIGVIAVMFGQVTAGVITAISSIVPNVAAALFFVQSKNANERVDTVQMRLTEARELQTALEMADTIDDPRSRDKLKAEIVRKALRLDVKDKSGE